MIEFQNGTLYIDIGDNYSIMIDKHAMYWCFKKTKGCVGWWPPVFRCSKRKT